MNNDTVTIRGNVGNDPVTNTTPGGATVVNFRVGSSTGYWDRRTDNWVETGTNWYAVSAFRQLAEHTKASVRRGDAVIVTGTLKLREWESNGRKGLSADLVADAVGHDLNRGTSAFVRRPRATVAQPVSQSASSPGDDTSRIDPPTDEMRRQWSTNGLNDLVDESTGEVEVDDEEPSYAPV